MALAVNLTEARLFYRIRRGLSERTVIVLDKFSLQVSCGRVAAILGVSGCGKSTLLRVISGVERLQAGTIEVLGGSPRAALRSGKTAIASSDSALLPWRSALSNVRLPLDLLGRQRATSNSLAYKLLSDLKIAALQRSRPGEMSDGQRQRVRLAQALATEPELLLLDEPFNNADEGLRDLLTTFVSEYIRKAARRCGVIITHSVHEAASIADEIIIVGGPPLEILHRESIAIPALSRKPNDVNDIAAVVRPYLLRRAPEPVGDAA